MKEEYAVLEYNQTTTEVELVNVSALWDEVCSYLNEFVYLVKLEIQRFQPVLMEHLNTKIYIYIHILLQNWCKFGI